MSILIKDTTTVDEATAEELAIKAQNRIQSYHDRKEAGLLTEEEKRGIEAYGVGTPDMYNGKEYREFREILARNKDFIKCIFKPEPTFLGEKIDIHGDGTITDNEK